MAAADYRSLPTFVRAEKSSCGGPIKYPGQPKFIGFGETTSFATPQITALYAIVNGIQPLTRDRSLDQLKQSTRFQPSGFGPSEKPDFRWDIGNGVPYAPTAILGLEPGIARSYDMYLPLVVTIGD